MKKYLISILLFVYFNSLFGQRKDEKIYHVSQIQGIWQMYQNYTDANEDEFYKVFHIFKGRNWLLVNLTEDLYGRFGVVLINYGFSNYSAYDDLDVDNIGDSGQYFVSVFEENSKILFNVSSIFELKPKKYLNLFGDECWYLEKAPKEVLEVLYKRGKHDKRDYIKEFLDINVCGIKTEKSYIYDSTYTRTKMYLIKDDIITILEEGDGFVKMEYETKDEKIIKGWIKKEDIECVEPTDKSIK